MKEYSELWTAACLVGGGLVVGFIVRALVRVLFNRWFSRARVADIAFRAVRSHIVLWFTLAGILLALNVLDLPAVWNRNIHRVVLILIILSVCTAVSRLLTDIIPYFARRFSISVPATSLTNNLIQLFVFVLGILVILMNLGISIGPMLTALGVGSLAVGLALQETLSNIFAGFYLLLSREIKVGDDVDLERGIGYGPHKGKILDIYWRSSRLALDNGELLIVPNSFMTQSIITVHNREPVKTPPLVDSNHH